MRLFRRSLLCLVVGVTAFGVAGWAFRPRASWTAVLKAANFATFVDAVESEAAGFPIWIHHDVEIGDSQRFKVLAFDARTGNRLYETPELTEYFGSRVTSDGRLLIERSPDDVGAGRESEIQVIDAATKSKTLARSLKGRWHATRSGGIAWSATKTHDGVECTVVALAADKEVCRESIVLGRPTDVCDVSEDGTLLAAFRWPDRSATRPSSVLLWNLKERRLERELSFPPMETDRPSNDGLGIQFRSSQEVEVYERLLRYIDSKPAPGKSWLVDFELGRIFRSRERPRAPPPDQGVPLSIDYEWEHGSKSELWIAQGNEGSPTLFALERNNIEVFPWRRFPFPLSRDPSFNEPFVRWTYWTRFFIHPRRDWLVVHSVEPPPIEEVPKSFLPFLPASFRSEEPVERSRWYDWRADLWRDVGCPPFKSLQFRTGSMLTVSKRVDDVFLLQSWPLPPRDPKWPALGVAALSMAATWWACARRFARRLRRTS